MDRWVYLIYVDHLLWGEALTQSGNTIWCGSFSVEFLSDGRVIIRGVDELTECPYETIYNEYGVVECEIGWLKFGQRYSQGYLDEKGEWKQEWLDEDDIELA